MHRSLTLGLALATLGLGLASPALGAAEDRPRPHRVDDLGIRNDRDGRSDRPGKPGGIVALGDRPSLQAAPTPGKGAGDADLRPLEGDAAEIQAANVESHGGAADPRPLEDDAAEIQAADVESHGGVADLPDWKSCDPFDVNADGAVDMEDFAELLGNFGMAEGDLTGDGLVDGEDLGLLLIRISNLPRD